jgi:Kef-type K+ transport system membrane component KefB
VNNLSLAVHFFLQISVILFTCRLVGLVVKRFGQPQVVGEMIAGVLLGPSLFGLLAPETQSLLFPWDLKQQIRDTQSYLYPISQLGLALYMFVVGLEFRLDVVKEHFSSALAVSLAGMIAPFILGTGVAYVLYSSTEIFPAKTSLLEAMLFLGSALCITAFPMLARIIHFKGLSGTRMGTVAIGAGAIDDATAWCLLALVLASFDNNISIALVNILGAVLFLLFVTYMLKPMIRMVSVYFIKEDTLTENGLVLAIGLMSLGAWFTDLIGLHAVFGAFIIGTAIPRGVFARDLIKKFEPLSVTLLLPLFFTYSGLNTKIGLINSLELWAWSGVILIAAVLGKGVACSFAARLTGVPIREALGIGALMNARGLMELIIINIGLQRGVISGELFSMLVIMAIVTTLMASPIFDRVIGNLKFNEV